MLYASAIRKPINCYSKWPLRKLTALAFGFLIALPAPRAGAQAPGSLPWYQTTINTVVANARRLIEPVLTSEQRAIAQSIDYRVTSSGGIGAFAAMENGRRVMVITAGTAQVMDWIYDAVVLETRLDKSGCYKEFMTYLYEAIQENQRRISNGMQPRAVPGAATYAVTRPGDCSGVTVRQLTSLPDYGEDRAKQMEASIMFLYLHELGHHVLGHTARADLRSPPTLAMSREREDAADKFAVETALKVKYFLTVATPWNALMAAFGGNSIEAEQKADHPLGIKRVLTIFDQTATYYRNNPRAWPDPRTYDRLMSDLQLQRQELQEQVETLE